MTGTQGDRAFLPSVNVVLMVCTVFLSSQISILFYVTKFVNE